MSLRIETFHKGAGNSLYKALSHPLAAERADALVNGLTHNGRVAIYDPDGVIDAFDALYPLAGVQIAGLFVQNVEHLSHSFRNHGARPVTDLPSVPCETVLVASFDEARAKKQIGHLLPAAATLHSFESLKIPAELQSDRERYLSPLNFATNFAFFRDEKGRHTRIVSSNYWARYGAKNVRLWCRLFDTNGAAIATWTQPCADPEGSIIIDSAEIRARFNLPEFTGQLFLQAVGAAGHDVVKYALFTYGDDADVLSSTHDANSWPSDLYAGLPAPDEGEDVILWLQNSHPNAIPAGAIGLSIMGHGEIVPLNEEIAPFTTRRLSVAELLPQLRWPGQAELHAGKHVVRPRYEVIAKNGRARMAHVNVERADLKSDANLAKLGALMGKGHILPAPVFPANTHRTLLLPTPMSTAQTHLPVKALIYDANGAEIAQHRFGNLARDKSVALDASALIGSGYGHVELVYDFDAGDVADGWLHALFRYVDLKSGHVAETSFGSHIFNTALTYKGEPQSYSGPPPGLSTRLFLPVAPAPWETLCHLIYPVSQSWQAHSKTALILMSERGAEIARKEIRIPASGSLMWKASQMFDAATLAGAGKHPYIVVRDETCRLFGYQGAATPAGAFSFDHMFGF